MWNRTTWHHVSDILEEQLSRLTSVILLANRNENISIKRKKDRKVDIHLLNSNVVVCCIYRSQSEMVKQDSFWSVLWIKIIIVRWLITGKHDIRIVFRNVCIIRKQIEYKLKNLHFISKYKEKI